MVVNYYNLSQFIINLCSRPEHVNRLLRQLRGLFLFAEGYAAGAAA